MFGSEQLMLKEHIRYELGANKFVVKIPLNQLDLQQRMLKAYEDNVLDAVQHENLHQNLENNRFPFR